MVVSHVELIQRGHSARLTESGWEITEVRIVTRDLIGADSFNGPTDQDYGYGVMMRIVEQNDFPKIGDPHPAKETAILKEIFPVPRSTGDIEISYVYRENLHKTTKITISSNAQEVEVNTGLRVVADVNGKTDPIVFAGKGGVILPGDSPAGKWEDITVSYDYPDNHPDKGGQTRNETKTGHLSTTHLPRTSMTVVKDIEMFHENIISDSINYVGTLNSEPFDLVFEDRAYVWKCMDISGESLEPYKPLGALQWYRVTYVFEYVGGVVPDQRGFKKVIFIDPTTGKPPKDLKWQLGPLVTEDDPAGEINPDPKTGPASQKYYMVDEAKNFNNLGLVVKDDSESDNPNP